MGRGRRQKHRHESGNTVGQPRRGGMKAGLAGPRQKLMDRGALEAVWRDGGCGHPAPDAAMYGRCAMVSCSRCKIAVQFLLRFGRPKTLDVYRLDGEVRHVGRASVSGVRDFIYTNAEKVMLPENGSDSEGEFPRRDSTMLDILLETLDPVDPKDMLTAPVNDFESAWRGIDCGHCNVSCQAYSHSVDMECRDCATSLMFTHISGDTFHITLTRLPLDGESYGPHGAADMVRILREFAGDIGLPTMMADRMSDDPDRDARQLAGVIAALERHGLLRRIDMPDWRSGVHGDIIEKVSALDCDRERFGVWVKHFTAVLRANGTKCMDGRRRVSARRMLEAARLSWPCIFEGDGVGVTIYEAGGSMEHCVRCGFSTLDDDELGADHWERGCPECGYAGYLLEMDKGRAGGAPPVIRI